MPVNTMPQYGWSPTGGYSFGSLLGSPSPSPMPSAMSLLGGNDQAAWLAGGAGYQPPVRNVAWPGLDGAPAPFVPPPPASPPAGGSIPNFGPGGGIPVSGPSIPAPPNWGPPPPSAGGTTGAGGIPGYPIGGDTGNSVFTIPGTPGTPETGGTDWGDVSQLAGLGGAVFGLPGLLAGAVPIINSDPVVPAVPGTADQSYMVGPTPGAGYDAYGSGAAPGSALNMMTPTLGVPGAEVTALNNPDGSLSGAGLDAATSAVNSTLATLPPSVAAQIAAAIQNGVDPLDAFNAQGMAGNILAGNTIAGPAALSGNSGSSADVLDAIGQTNGLVAGSGQELLFGDKWRSHLGLLGAMGQPWER